ncbi:MAG: hypothetical protein CO141_02790 [Candidatus Moranbacteria bacterium CG_4_9_14_3_um_filter_42_9]|nr:MAG: hypothetical protein CO141_02790 [Candidatus Moranbacteria bacterium CG_4_9_14_3_um_filter_42_9]
MTALLILYLVIIIFLIYLLIDLFQTGNINTFIDNWLKKALWIWLPFYALWRLTKEVILKSK